MGFEPWYLLIEQGLPQTCRQEVTVDSDRASTITFWTAGTRELCVSDVPVNVNPIACAVVLHLSKNAACLVIGSACIMERVT